MLKAYAKIILDLRIINKNTYIKLQIIFFLKINTKLFRKKINLDKKFLR